jgi:YVTN family beta-propeller protein
VLNANTPPIRSEAVPGTRWNDSGGGYTIMRQVFLDVTKEPFPKLLQDTVLAPIGMTRSTYEQPLPQNLRENAATPYHRGMGCLIRWIIVSGLLSAACGRAGEPTRPASSAAAETGVNIYAGAGANNLSPEAARARPLVYVPNSKSASVTVIDPKTYTAVRTFPTGRVPQHVVPSYDLRTLWVANNAGNSLTPIDPTTGQEGRPVSVDDPYNLYFTPDGRYAMVIAEARHRLDFRDPRTMKVEQSLRVDCSGVDHVEFTVDERYAIATCEFSGKVVKIDLTTHSVAGYLTLDPHVWTSISRPIIRMFHRTGKASLPDVPSMPQDIRSSPEGSVFYAADMKEGGVFLIDPVALQRIGFIKTGIGAHGLYPSRDGTRLYVTNRGWSTIAGGRHGPGSISVLDFATRKVMATWPVPGGGSPDMGNVSADGRELWVSGRYDDEVYVFDTGSGRLTHRIPVGREPHGLCIWPQPGRRSLGHTGNMR